MPVTKKIRIAVIVDIVNSYGRGLVRGICDFLREHPESVIFFEERMQHDAPPKWLKDWRGDGIIVRDKNLKTCRIALKTGAKVVDMSEHRHPGVPTIYTNYRMSAQLAVNHFLECGFENFAYVGLEKRPFSEKRKSAFFELVGVGPFFDFSDDPAGVSPLEKGYRKLANWLRKLPKPVGIMAGNDSVGIRVLQVCKAIGIGIPESVAIIGVSDDDVLCSMSNPTMSSVDISPEKIGFEAASLLFDLIHGKPAPETPMMVAPAGISKRGSTDVIVVPDSISSRAIKIIRQYAYEKISVPEIALELRVSRRTLERRFLQHVGHSIHTEIVNAKLALACELLTTTRLPLRSIAKRIGFDSLSYFISLFHKKMGQSPDKYRQERVR